MGVTTSALYHSGCKYNLHSSETKAAYFSAQAKSDWLNTIIFNSSACNKMPDKGGLNFFGERHIQPHFPLTGCEPEVSILVVNPACC